MPPSGENLSKPVLKLHLFSILIQVLSRGTRILPFPI
jgi:hypothetical protein